LGAQIPEFENRIQLALDRAAVDDLAAELTLRTARQELSTVQRQLEEFLLGPKTFKAEVTAARAEVTEATTNRDRVMTDWRIMTEVLQAAESNLFSSGLYANRETSPRPTSGTSSRASRSSCCTSRIPPIFRSIELPTLCGTR
jgi:hypothetical protein